MESERNTSCTNLHEKVCEIIKSYGVYEGYKNPDECVERIKALLKENHIGQFIVQKDPEVYNDAGVDVYYVAATWIEPDETLRLCGGPVYSC